MYFPWEILRNTHLDAFGAWLQSSDRNASLTWFTSDEWSRFKCSGGTGCKSGVQKSGSGFSIISAAMDAQFRLPEEAPPARPGREEHTLPSELRSFQEVFQQVQAALMPRYASLLIVVLGTLTCCHVTVTLSDHGSVHFRVFPWEKNWRCCDEIDSTY